MNKFINANCFDIFPQLEEKSVSLIITDPPFSQTPLTWDKPFDIQRLWQEYGRIIKPNGCVLFFGQEPFSSKVRLSNLEDYRYDWYWVKERLTSVFQVKRRPGKVVETISVFYKNQPTYNPQKQVFMGKKVTNKIGDDARWSVTMAGHAPNSKPLEYIDDGTRHPTQILNFNRDNARNNIHDTQKPLSLLKYFVNTYTNECDLVLDCFAGSASSLVAAKLLNRQYIGIEKDEGYFKLAEQRLNEIR